MPPRGTELHQLLCSTAPLSEVWSTMFGPSRPSNRKRTAFSSTTPLSQALHTFSGHSCRSEVLLPTQAHGFLNRQGLWDPVFLHRVYSTSSTNKVPLQPEYFGFEASRLTNLLRFEVRSAVHQAQVWLVPKNIIKENPPHRKGKDLTPYGTIPRNVTNSN